MKSILIIGTKNGGKSTTITAVCKKLKPTITYKLNTALKKLEFANITDIFNNTYIIEVNEKFILVVAGAPTEQNITLRELIDITIQINIKISFLIVAKRTSEKKINFNTVQDIQNLSTLVHTKKLKHIPLIDKNDQKSFKQNQEWINRIDKLEKLIIENI